MKPRFLLSVVLIVSVVFCQAQFDTNVYYLNGVDKESHYDSLIRSRFTEPVPSSYFLITYPLNGGVTTYGPQFGKAYYEIKNSKQRNAPILVVFSNEGGLRPQDIDLFIREIFHIEPKEINYVVDEGLYQTLNGNGLLMHLLYFYRGKPLFNSVSKLYNYSGQKLPYEHVNLGKPKTTLLRGLDSSLIQEYDPLVPYNETTILIQGEVRDAIYTLDLNSGNVKKLFALTDYHAGSEVYCRLYAGGDSAKCQFARKYDSLLSARNRQTLNVDGVRMYDGKLTGFFATEAYEVLTEPYTYRNDENKKVTVPVGTPGLNAFQGYFEYHIASKELNLFGVGEVNSGKSTLYIAPSASFYNLNDSQIITDIWYDPISQNKPILCKLQKKNGQLEVFQFLDPKTNKKESELADFQSSRSYYFKFNNGLYYCSDISPKIYPVNASKPISKLYGDMTAPYEEEKFRSYAQDTVRGKINFRIRSIEPIMDDEYLAIYYIYKNNHIIEIKNSVFKTVDIIFLNQLEGFEDYCKGYYGGLFNVLITNNQFHFTYLKGDQFYLNSYEFIKSP